MLTKKDIQIIAQNSSLTKDQIAILLSKNVYPNSKDWQSFLRRFLLSIGISFLSIGILFFFAYNWQDLHRFLKLGILAILIIITVLLSLKYRENKKNISYILLTSTSLLVGILFAVFGQIYQTGANAYDFFLSWTITIFLWVLTTKFEPLWLLFIVLINVTYLMYSEQVATNWSDSHYFFILLLLDFPILLFFETTKKKYKTTSWFLYLLGLYNILIGTLAIMQGIYNKKDLYFFINLIFVLLFFCYLLLFSIKQKSTFYISLISVSIISIINAIILKFMTNSSGFLLVGLFTILSTTILVKLISTLKNKWKDAA